MKKILWTSVFWLAIIALFGAYMRFFDSNLASKVIPIFVKEMPVNEEVATFTGDTLSTPIFEALTALDTEMDIIAVKLTEIKDQEASIVSSQRVSTSAPTVVKLYYFNEQEDKKLPLAQQASPESLVPIIRTVPQTDNIIRDAISLLLQGALTDSEFKNGFTSDFVRAIRLDDMNLNTDGTLELSFTRAPGANMGGSTFIAILTSSIIKTALQFPQVKRVELLPEGLFQP